MFSKLLAFGTLAALTVSAAPEKVLVDTDPGKFTDDEHAAVMLPRSPGGAQVLGMTGSRRQYMGTGRLGLHAARAGGAATRRY